MLFVVADNVHYFYIRNARVFIRFKEALVVHWTESYIPLYGKATKVTCKDWQPDQYPCWVNYHGSCTADSTTGWITVDFTFCYEEPVESEKSYYRAKSPKFFWQIVDEEHRQKEFWGEMDQATTDHAVAKAST